MTVICEKKCKAKAKDGTCTAPEIKLLRDGSCGAFIKAPGYEPIREDNVVVFDDVGLPSIMVRFTRMTDKELFGGENRPHPMFVIRDELYDEVYISKYKNVIVNGRAYSWPMQTPTVNITNDEAQAACRSKGDGWHLLTMMEHGFLANLSLKLGTLPHGNTSFGKYNADENEHGILCPGSSERVLTGSGPDTWLHDHTVFGADGLCGDIWEHVAGFRLMNGILQAPCNNDAAAGIDLSAESSEWKNVTKEGKPICLDASDGLSFRTCDEEPDANSDCQAWGNVKFAFAPPDIMRELGLFPGDKRNYLYADTEGERLPRCGGNWSLTSKAGVFTVTLYHPRSRSGAYLGFRSAFCKRKPD